MFFPRWFNSACVLILLCLGVAAPAAAQYQFDHWTAGNGLPQNSVRDIVQTQDGYLWFTTFDGLVRFDGVRFTVFNKSNSPGIITNRFVQLFEDAQGDLWASTEDGALTRLHQGRFTSYTQGQGLPGGGIVSMGDNGQGNLVFIAHTSQAFRWWEGRFQPAAEVRLPSPEQGRSRTQRLPHTHGTDPQTAFIDGQLHSFKRPATSLILSHPVQDQQGQTWFSDSTGLSKFEQGQWIPGETLGKRLPGKEVRLVYGRLPLQALSVSDNGALWLTALDSMQSHFIAPTAPEGMGVRSKAPDLVVVYGDREGNLWFGTLYNGLFRARRQAVTAYTKSQGLQAREIYPLLEDRAGTIWIGTGGEGLFSFQEGVFTRYKHTYMPGNTITSLFEDRRGRLWVNKAQRFEHGRLVRGFIDDVMPGAMSACWVVFEDQDGAFWFGSDIGVVRYKDGVRTHFTTKDGLAGDDTKVIIPDIKKGGAGGLWLGSYGGLTHFKDGRFTAWAEHDGLPGNTVRALKQDDDGTLWIGTYDSGLGRFKDGKFTRYTTKEGLFDNGVFQILEDDFGWVWMSCNRGVYRVRKQELNDFAEGKSKTITSIAYGKSDGMANVECNGGRWPAGIKARDGKLWFPTMGGVAVIDPAAVTTNTQPPPVVIESVLIDRAQAAVENEIRIAPQQSNFEIRYTALSFINSENLRFKYKLEGMDQDWVEAGQRRTAYFSYVPPGEYTFKVIAANSDGVWNMRGQSLKVTVLPPFYRTWWFLGLAALSMTGLGWLVWQYRVAQLKRAQAAQRAFSRQLIASQEGERKRIAAELHDSLGQHLVIIKNLALLSLSAPANNWDSNREAREQLEEISVEASQAIGEVKEISYNLRPYQLDRIGLTKAVEAIVKTAAAASQIAFTAEIDEIDDAFPKESEINFYRIVQESLSNIVKHAQATETSVQIRRDAGHLRLTIRDNGKGFSPGPTNADSRGGFGLIGISERAQLLGGRATIHSAPGQGTTLSIEIALRERHHDE